MARKIARGRQARKRTVSPVGPAAIPPVGVVDVVERDADGDLYVRLSTAREAPPVRLAPDRVESFGSAPGLGDKLLVRFAANDTGETEARLIKRLGRSAHRILGVARKSRGEVRLEPVDRRANTTLVLHGADAAMVKEGDLALAQVLGDGRRPHGPKPGRLLEVVGRQDDPRVASLIAIHSQGLPTGFSPAAEAEARAAKPTTAAGRTDLRQMPLITIDPADARDHDDAVFAAPDDDPSNRGGWVVWVAIADIAAFVGPGSALDREAREKGNSVYFPDRVEPMLPELLSAGLCSLRPDEVRACLAVRMTFDAGGAKQSHRFHRAIMRSAAKLSYEQAQAAIEGVLDGTTADLLDLVLRPLWAAYAALQKARDVRSPLDIESQERRIVFAPDGTVSSITPRRVLEAHRLIEEFMVQANTCAAQTLEQHRSPLIYRVHEPPSEEKLTSLADFLATLDIAWSKGEAPTTRRFNRLLSQVRGGPHAEIINEVVLRTQMQARYATDNLGHFGLNLARYAHFTSPIRRYADLIVHRALIGSLDLGEGGLSREDAARMTDTAERITFAERRAMAAERGAGDRYVAAFMESKLGAQFTGRITGVTRFGLFVRLLDTGADGLVPISSLGTEYFLHDEQAHALVGERSGERWRLGAAVEVRLREAIPITGGILLEMLSNPEPADTAARSKSTRRGRGSSRRRFGRTR